MWPHKRVEAPSDIDRLMASQFDEDKDAIAVAPIISEICQADSVALLETS